jgi:hypothetical protein
MTHEQWIETQTLRTGDLLPNGWTVISANGDADRALVLAGNAGNVHPYATWFARLDGDSWTTFWGTYHLTLQEAIDTFQQRSGL